MLWGAMRARRAAARFGGRDPNLICTCASFLYERWYVECCERCARSSVVCLCVQSIQTHKKMLFEYSSLVAYRVGPSTTVGVRSVTAENLRESAATAKTIRCKTEVGTTYDSSQDHLDPTDRTGESAPVCGPIWRWHSGAAARLPWTGEGRHGETQIREK